VAKRQSLILALFALKNHRCQLSSDRTMNPGGVIEHHFHDTGEDVPFHNLHSGNAFGHGLGILCSWLSLDTLLNSKHFSAY
jgi:hypothetical protein